MHIKGLNLDDNDISFDWFGQDFPIQTITDRIAYHLSSCEQVFLSDANPF